MKYWVLFFLFFLACETFEEQTSYPLSFSSEGASDLCEEFSFQGMGTLWRVVYCAGKRSIKKEFLESSFISKVSLYDEAFSTWSKESELGKLNNESFSRRICPSVFFMEALASAKKYYELTEGAFDVSLGSGDFKSLRLEETQACFSFTSSPPKKLDFNGFVKGIAVGALAELLEKSGADAFYVNAGNGNLAYKVPRDFEKHFMLEEKYFPRGHDKAYFLSQSASVQSHTGEDHQHIQDPREDKKFQREAQVLCFSELNSVFDWKSKGGLSDAFSTALTIKPSLKLPLDCFLLD